jgi:hypothetical protein
MYKRTKGKKKRAERVQKFNDGGAFNRLIEKIYANA